MTDVVVPFALLHLYHTLEYLLREMHAQKLVGTSSFSAFWGAICSLACSAFWLCVTRLIKSSIPAQFMKIPRNGTNEVGENKVIVTSQLRVHARKDSPTVK